MIMSELKQQALDGFDGCENEKPKEPEKPPFKYLEIEVTRQQSTIIFLKVPQDFNTDVIKRQHGKESILVKACKETCFDSDWDSYGWEYGEVDYQSIKEVSENDATCYTVYEVKPLEIKK